MAHLSTLRATQFTAFRSLDVEFCAGLNVLIGENGAGKSHLMKLAYTLSRAARPRTTPDDDGARDPWIQAVSEAMQSNFKPDRLGRLCRRKQGVVDTRVHLTTSGELPAEMSAEWSSQARSQVRDAQVLRRAMVPFTVFLPSREVLSIYPGFAHAIENRELAFDGTYLDLCRALEAGLLRPGVREPFKREIAELIEAEFNVSVELRETGFCVKTATNEKLEAALVAEGLRKLATVLYLVLNGSIAPNSTLFWDEPEANMNPRWVALIARLLARLATLGVQVIISTHDYLLLQRIELERERGALATGLLRYLSLYVNDPDADTQVEQSAALHSLEHNTVFDEFARLFDDRISSVAE
jgi:ABC-type transport system involved in cytochrome c biogenesis ATPase subunit